MAGPWEDYAPAQAAPAEGPWTEYATPGLVGAPGTTQVRMSPKPFNVLPFSEDTQGKISFDINAGLPGALIRAVSAPNDALRGKFDPMSQEGQARARETAAFFGTGANPAVRAGDRAIPGELMSARRQVPSADQLKTAATQGYDAARATDAAYPGQAVADTASATQRGLEGEGFFAENAPLAFSTLRKLQDLPAEPSTVRIDALDAARKALNKIPRPIPGQPGGADYAAAQQAIREIDGFIARRGERVEGDAAGGSVAGPAAAEAPAAGANGAGIGGGAADPLSEAARLIQQARGNSAANFRSGRVTRAEDIAEVRANAANSGQNLGNNLRQRLATLLLDENATRGFSPEELAALRRIVEGTFLSNGLRRVSNMLGGGGGIGQTLIGATGAIAGGQAGGLQGAALGASPAVVGAVSRTGYNRLVNRQVGKLDEMIRQRSPLYDEMSLLPEKQDLRRAILLRGLLGSPTTGLLGDYQP